MWRSLNLGTSGGYLSFIPNRLILFRNNVDGSIGSCYSCLHPAYVRARFGRFDVDRALSGIFSHAIAACSLVRCYDLVL